MGEKGGINMQDFPESGKIIKFSELDNDIQKAFFAINEDIENVPK